MKLTRGISGVTAETHGTIDTSRFPEKSRGLAQPAKSASLLKFELVSGEWCNTCCRKITSRELYHSPFTKPRLPEPPVVHDIQSHGSECIVVDVGRIVVTHGDDVRAGDLEGESELGHA